MPPELSYQAPPLVEDWVSIVSYGVSNTEASSSQTEMRMFDSHFFPSHEQKYFFGQLSQLHEPEGYWVNVVVTAYNEIGQDLEDTLESLEAQAQNLKPGCRMHVLLVFDGWWKVSPCMQRVLQRLYPGVLADLDGPVRDKTAKPRWMEELDRHRSDQVKTFSVQEAVGGELVPVELSNGRSLLVSALIKLDNRRKHNSHEWFLRAFSLTYPAKYLFFTDVGTTADKHCIPRLAAYMDTNPEYVATTGFQRVLSRPGSSFVQRLHAEIQSYELGPGMCATIKAAQAFIGFQMILCGPCTMVRASNVTPEVLDNFFEMMNKDPALGGVMLANLQLTEDMAFGCYLYAHNSKGKTGYVPDAYFNYDVETQPDRYLKQRRRWMNGIIAGMNHLLFRLLFRHRRSVLQTALLGTVFIFQYHFAMQFLILPAFYMCATYSMLGGFHTDPAAQIYMVNAIQPAADWVPAAGAASLWLFLAIWAVIHHRQPYVGWLYHAVLFLVMLGGGFLGGGSIAVWRISPEGEFWNSSSGDFRWGLAASIMGGIAASVPILSALVSVDLRGLRVSVLNMFLQLWFMPMYCLTGAYSIARFSDFTWGNRPHQSQGTDGARRDACMEHCKQTGRLVLAAYLAVNALFGTGLILLGHYRWFGIDPFIVAVCDIVVPVATSSVFGFLFTAHYMLRHRCLPAVRAALRMEGGPAKLEAAREPLLGSTV
mmetsp:Transcript_878/g.2656  ORF Transcript_878/g.2656 Transcript_878/m.2656 type:complete len:708 (+) Transcript_878:298-2421(+)